MKRLKLLGLLEERDELLNKLLQLGCVEVTDTEEKLTDPEYAALLRKDSTAFSNFRSINTKLSAALDKLKKYAPAKQGLFILRREVTTEEFFSSNLWTESLEVVNKINSLEDEISRLFSEKSKLESLKEALAPWLTLDVPLDLSRTNETAVVLGTIPALRSYQEMETKLYSEIELSQLFQVSADKELQYFMLVCHNTVLEQSMSILRENGYNQPAFKEASGTAVECTERLVKQIAAIDDKIRERSEKIKSFADKRQDLQICLDRSVQEMTREEAKEKLLSTDLIYAMEGWVAVTGLNEFEKLIASYACAYELEDPAADEEAPILFKNSKLISSVHMVIEMYSLPSYHGVDPNPLIFPFFVFYYGLMFADVGYGLIMFFLGFFITRKYKPKGGVGQILQLAMVLGVSATVFGVFTGSYFGDAIPVIAETFLGKTVTIWAILNPLQNPMNVLIFAIILGCIHMLFGQLIHIYIGFRDHHPIDAMCDVIPWWTLFAGIAMAVLKSSNTLMWIGVVFLVLTQGRAKKSLIGKLFGGIASLYNITSWLGDVLSYSRLMALMLASTVIASVVNILGALPGSIIAFIPIFLFGHTLNLAINVIGTFVHAARLQYLEFFSKFYIDGGKPFRPLCYNTKYVDIVAPVQEVK